MNSIKFPQCGLSLVSVLMLMDHPSSARSLISSPYLPHHFIWPKGNNKSLIHYPLTEAAMRKYLITGNKLNFNHRHFLSATLHRAFLPKQICPYATLSTIFCRILWQISILPEQKGHKLLSSSTHGSLISPNTHTHTRTHSLSRAVERLIYLKPRGW